MDNDTSNLTLKQRKWIKEYLECGNATEAAMRAYNCKTRRSANAIGAKNLIKLDLSNEFDNAGFSIFHLIHGLVEGTRATKIYGINEVKPDYHVRHKYLVTILRLKGIYPHRRKQDVTNEATRILIKG